MDKQKQIEEMAKDMCGISYTSVTGDCVCGELKFECNCKCKHFERAKRLYNAGYRKIPENAVVLTEGAYSDLLLDEVNTIKRDIAEYWATQDVDIVAKELHKDGYRKLDDHAIFVLRKAKCLEEKVHKETAEKFARLVEFHSISTRDEESREIFTISALCLKEILHEEFGIPYDEICKGITEGKKDGT